MSTASFEYDEENIRGGLSSTKNWDMGTSANSRAFGGESWSYEYIAHQNQNVHLLQKIKPVSSRPKIPATLSERLAFFRVYFNSFGKTIGTYDLFDFNRLVWDHFFYVVFKLIPISYIYYFLGSYVPEEHLYISKMVPIFAGYNILLVIGSLTLLTLQGSYVILMFYYAFAGLIFHSPWKRSAIFGVFYSVMHPCCNNTLPEQMMANLTCVETPALLKLKNESFHLIRIERIRLVPLVPNITKKYIVPALSIHYTMITTYLHTENRFICIAVFIVAGLFYKQVYKRYIWKILRIFQTVLQIIYAASLAHLLLISLESQFEREEDEDEKDYHNIYHRTIQDSSIFQAMVHAPPLIHFISARTTDQVNPASDTALLVLSNTMFFFLKLLTHQKILKYCEYVTGFCLKVFSDKNTFMFFFWPLYLSMMPYGDILISVVYVVNFMTEFLTFVICYQSFIEVFLSKWESVRKWIALAVLTVMMIVFPHLIVTRGYVLAFAIVLWASAFIEVAIIIFFYPVSRLLDDIGFHYGSTPSQLTQSFLKVIPVSYFVLFYIFYHDINDYCADNDKCSSYILNNLYASLITVTASMATGTVYMIIRTIYMNVGEWGSLIRPVPDWGPLDHIQRQLRKYYDSREYIRSRESRYLSRYLMTRASERSYQLDLLYERQGVRSTLLQDALRVHNENAKEKTE